MARQRLDMAQTWVRFPAACIGFEAKIETRLTVNQEKGGAIPPKPTDMPETCPRCHKGEMIDGALRGENAGVEKCDYCGFKEPVSLA